MKVYDHEVSESHYAAAIERMQRADDFRASDIEHALRDAGLPQHGAAKRNGGAVVFLSNRVADRIIQQQKKLGNIGLVGGARWRWLRK
jgi:hypothetical protein